MEFCVISRSNPRRHHLVLLHSYHQLSTLLLLWVFTSPSNHEQWARRQVGGRRKRVAEPNAFTEAGKTSEKKAGLQMNDQWRALREHLAKKSWDELTEHAQRISWITKTCKVRSWVMKTTEVFLLMEKTNIANHKIRIYPDDYYSRSY